MIATSISVISSEESSTVTMEESNNINSNSIPQEEDSSQKHQHSKPTEAGNNSDDFSTASESSSIAPTPPAAAMKKEKSTSSSTQEKQEDKGNSDLRPLTKNDVICARLSSAHKHLGNQRYNALIDKHHLTYQTADRRDEKARITNLVIDTIEQETGGFFLRPVGDDQWTELDKFAKREKVTHALRNAKHHRLTKEAKQKSLERLKELRMARAEHKQSKNNTSAGSLKETKQPRRAALKKRLAKRKHRDLEEEAASSSGSSVSSREQRQQQQLPAEQAHHPSVDFAASRFHLPAAAAAAEAQEELFLAQLMQRRLQRRRQLYGLEASLAAAEQARFMDPHLAALEREQQILSALGSSLGGAGSMGHHASSLYHSAAAPSLAYPPAASFRAGSDAAYLSFLAATSGTPHHHKIATASAAAAWPPVLPSATLPTGVYQQHLAAVAGRPVLPLAPQQREEERPHKKNKPAAAPRDEESSSSSEEETDDEEDSVVAPPTSSGRVAPQEPFLRQVLANPRTQEATSKKQSNGSTLII